MDPALLGTASAFGLAASAGLNTTLPLLCIGLLARFGLIQLVSPFDALSSPLALGVLAVLALAEFVGDKVPAVDSIVHALQWPPAAAAGVHGARTAARPIVTGTTLGTGNTAVSLAEDGYALTLAGTAALAPALGLLLLVLLVAAIAVAIAFVIRGGRHLRGAGQNLTR